MQNLKHAYNLNAYNLNAYNLNAYNLNAYNLKPLGCLNSLTFTEVADFPDVINSKSNGCKWCVIMFRSSSVLCIMYTYMHVCMSYVLCIHICMYTCLIYYVYIYACIQIHSLLCVLLPACLQNTKTPKQGSRMQM